MRKTVAALLLAAPVCAWAQAPTDSVKAVTNPTHSGIVLGAGGCAGATTIYDTTHAGLVGTEFSSAANGAATNMGDKIVLAGTDRFICEIRVDVFSLVEVTPFDLTMNLWTDCSTSGAANSPCGNGAGTLIPGSTVTVTGIVPPGLGQPFTVIFPYPNLDLGGEADNTISVSIGASRPNALWILNETPVVGSLPAGEPATSVVERCGSVGTNNGCTRNFTGNNNNFAMQILANTTPVSLQSYSVE